MASGQAKLESNGLKILCPEMFRMTRADFGFLTTGVDLRAKNTNAAMYSYQGLNLESGVPGLYWINFFSGEFAERLGLRIFPRDLLNRSGQLAEECHSSSVNIQTNAQILIPSKSNLQRSSDLGLGNSLISDFQIASWTP